MPAKNSNETSTLRRSPRAPARVKVRFTESNKEKPSRKRKQSSIEKPEVSTSSVEVSTPTSKEPKSVRTSSGNSDSRKIDNYCWICHNEADDQVCAICPRVYHYQCLNAKNQFNEAGHCPECSSQSVDGTELEPNILNKLDVALPMILARIGEKHPLFWTWSASEKKNKKLIKIVDLSVIHDHIINEKSYNCTAALLADVKWILHNCYIIFGSHDQMTVKAKALVNECRNDLIDFEACAECFLKPNTDDSFLTICEKYHPLVWAKIKGFPYWGAKVLKIIDSVANIRFFGSHDKAKVPINQCYWMSDESPNDKAPKKATFQAAQVELDFYVKNVVDKTTSFHYKPLKTPFNPGSLNIRTKSLKGNQAQKSPAVKAKRAKLSIEENHEESQNVEETLQEIVDMDDSREDLSAESDVEIVAELQGQTVKKKSFMNNLDLLRSTNNNQAMSIVNINSNSLSMTPSISLQRLNIDKNHYQDVNEIEVLNPNAYFPVLRENKNDDVQVSDEENARNALQNVIEIVEENTEENSEEPQNNISQSDYRNDSQCLKDFSPNLGLESSSTEPKIETVTSNNVVHGSGVTNDATDDSIIVEFDKLHAKTADPLKVAELLQRYSSGLCQVVNNHFQNMVIDCLSTHIVCEKREAELKTEIEKLSQQIKEIRENTDLIIRNLKQGAEKGKQKAIEEAHGKWAEEERKRIDGAVDDAVKLKQEVSRKDHERFVSNVEAKYKSQLESSLDRLNKEKRTAIENIKKKTKKEFDDKISSIKRTQWCAFCLKEARFFCCWNTSYCDDECQRNHWPQHVDQCENICRFKEAFPDATTPMTPCTEMVLGGKKVKKVSDNSNTQALPMLRPTGQGQKFINSSLSTSSSSSISTNCQMKSPTVNNVSQKAKIASLSDNTKISGTKIIENENLENIKSSENEIILTKNSNSPEIHKMQDSKISNLVKGEDGASNLSNSPKDVKIPKNVNIHEEGKIVTETSNVPENENTSSNSAISNSLENHKNTSKVSNVPDDNAKTISKISSSVNDAKIVSKSQSSLLDNVKTSKDSISPGSMKTRSKILHSPETDKKVSLKEEKTPNSKTLVSSEKGKTPTTLKASTSSENKKTPIKKGIGVLKGGKTPIKKSNNVSTESGKIQSKKSGSADNAKVSENGKTPITKVNKSAEIKKTTVPKVTNSNSADDAKSLTVKNNALENTPTVKVISTAEGVKTPVVKVISPEGKVKDPSEDIFSPPPPKMKVIRPVITSNLKSLESKDIKGADKMLIDTSQSQ